MRNYCVFRRISAFLGEESRHAACSERTNPFEQRPERSRKSAKKQRNGQMNVHFERVPELSRAMARNCTEHNVSTRCAGDVLHIRWGVFSVRVVRAISCLRFARARNQNTGAVQYQTHCPVAVPVRPQSQTKCEMCLRNVIRKTSGTCLTFYALKACGRKIETIINACSCLVQGLVLLNNASPLKNACSAHRL